MTYFALYFTLLLHISGIALPLKIIPENIPTKLFGTGSFLNGKLGRLCRLHRLLFHLFGNTQALNQTLEQCGFWQTATQIWSASKFCPNTSQTSQIPMGDPSFCNSHPVQRLLMNSCNTKLQFLTLKRDSDTHHA